MTELQLFNPAQLGETFSKNEQLSQRAVTAIEAKLKELPADLSQLNVVKGDEIEKEVNDLIIRGNDAVKMAKERRMVYTRKFDEIKSAFTMHEKNIESAVAGLKEYQTNWNREKYNRQEKEKRERENAMAIENAKINLKQYATAEFNKEALNKASAVVDRMVNKFYSLNTDALMPWIEEIKVYQPKILLGADLLVNIPQVPQLDPQTQNDIVSGVLASSIENLNAQYREKIIEERDKIVELAPSRLAELERIANDAEEAQKAQARIEAEQAERKAQEEKAKAEAEAKAQEEANAEKMDVAFENAAVDVATQLSKGTSVKLKYNPTTHKELLQLIQWYVINKMNLLTIDEANKKFSFVRTSANEALNNGEVIEGVPTEEDIRTRTSRK